MSKVKINKKKIALNSNEDLLVKLDALVRNSQSNKHDVETAWSLIRWYRANGFFTGPQQALAKSIVFTKIKKIQKKTKHYLYAITDGETVKLGMSSSIEKRIRALQTSNPRKLKIIWKYYIADTKAKAITHEKRLHRACKKHRLHGEWFSLDCMPIVKSFKPKDN